MVAHAIVLAVFGVLAAPAAAQESRAACPWAGSHQWLSTRPSPLDSAVLTVRGTTLKVCYSRPSARGRAVFDSVVRLDRAWRTGANEPTLLQLSSRSTVGGASLAAGTYVVMTVPRESGWAIAFFTTSETDPAAMFRDLKEAGTGTGEVEMMDERVERFTMRFEESADGTFLVLEWDKTRVRFAVAPAG